MSEYRYSLFCNHRKCGTVINTFAWVTSCSHAFCDEHEPESQDPDIGRKCPACDSPLRFKYDIVRADLNPSEEFKSMVLAGLSPEIVLDVASRAISFWCHQMYKEKLLQLAKATRAESHIAQIESSYETLIVKMKNDLQVENKKFESLRKVADDQAKRIQELEDSLNKKSRHLQSLQMKFEVVRRENLSAKVGLSQGMLPPECAMHTSPKYMDQQAMINIPANRNQCSQHQGIRLSQASQMSLSTNSTRGGQLFKFKPSGHAEPPTPEHGHFQFEFSDN